VGPDIRTYCLRMVDGNEIMGELFEGSLRNDVAETISRNAQGMYGAMFFSPLDLLSA
jgi:hypothetical protein